MQSPTLVHRACLLRPLPSGYSVKLAASALNRGLCRFSAAAGSGEDGKEVKNRNEWFVLPPFSPTINTSALGKKLTLHHTEQNCVTSADSATTMTALKWVIRCCPQVPRSLVQKLFRLRQVRREYYKTGSDDTIQVQGPHRRRVAAKDSMNEGDRICLPITVKEIPSRKRELPCKEKEINFIHSLELYKDSMIIAVNKPPGMPVQGGIGVKRSLDELAATCLRYDYSEPPRLVHRLDRDSSGILVMGRTQTSATLLHSMFRDRTWGASEHDTQTVRKVLHRRYWALVIGSPTRSSGLIAEPLGKVVMDGGKSERIKVIDSRDNVPSQHAMTEYRVISSYNGYTWLELSPLTGRKHQLRVHCAEVLGTPIVGDYKYGRLGQKNWKDFPSNDCEKHSCGTSPRRKSHPFGLDLDNGSIADKQPHLHLHCKHMVLPNLSLALQRQLSSSDCDLTDLESIKLVAPLPPHMQKSWEIYNS